MAPSADQTATRTWAAHEVFTTGEVAEICKVSQQTIIRCFDAGRLTGFRVPGSRFRRIPRDELIRFMRANEIPIPSELAGRTVMLFRVDSALVQRIVDEGSLAMTILPPASTEFELGEAVGRQPNLLVVIGCQGNDPERVALVPQLVARVDVIALIDKRSEKLGQIPHPKTRLQIVTAGPDAPLHLKNALTELAT